MLVHSRLCGTLIGKGGATIRSFNEDSKATFNISPPPTLQGAARGQHPQAAAQQRMEGGCMQRPHSAERGRFWRALGQPVAGPARAPVTSPPRSPSLPPRRPAGAGGEDDRGR